MKYFFLIAFSFLLLNNAAARADEEEALIPESSTETGLMEIGTSGAEPVFAYVPEHYKNTRSYPLVISFPGRAEPAEEHIHGWSSFAEKSGFIIAAPAFKLKEGESPYDYDRWLVGLIKEMTGRYRISKNRIFLFGKDRAAQYAAYVGTNYAGAFSGAALYNGAWQGPWERLIKIQDEPGRQIPFYIGLSDKNLAPEVERRAVEFQEKGYLLQIENFAAEDEPAFREKAFEWLDRKSDAWSEQVQTSQKSMGQRIWQNIVENVTIE